MHDITERLQRIEDRLAIADLIAGYGPAVDAGDGAAAAAAWAEDGDYRVGDHVFAGRAGVARVVLEPTHIGYMAQGCAHVLSPHVITVQGDHATARGHSCVFVRSGDGWQAARISANRWTFQRMADGWRVTLREARLLDGSADARALLGPGFGCDPA